MSTWFNAQTISERLTALRGNLSAREYFDAGVAERRLNAWKDIPAFADNEVFERRMALDSCSPEEFKLILGVPAEKIFPAGYTPFWLQEVFESEKLKEPPYRSLSLEDAASRGMITAFLPLIRLHADRLYQVLTKRQDVLAGMQLTAAQGLDLFLDPLIGRMEYLTRRAVALDINVKRILGLLEGETGEERFAFFVKLMSTSESRLAFLEAYSVLTRSMQKVLELWLDASIEFMERLSSDSDEIREYFSIEPGDSLKRFEPGAGDVHCKGRSVVVLTFESGKKILYKPRDLLIDVDYQNLLAWCNRKGLEQPLRTIRLLPKEHYGWVEFVQSFPCKTQEEVSVFYQRLGSILALLHTLVTVDMHFENIVAAGPDPIIIDLETLFHGEGIEYTNFVWASDLDAQRLRRSVMGVGLLPSPTVTEDNKTFDVSAIGASVGQQAPYKVTLLESMGKDDVHIVHVAGWIPSVHSRPTDDEIKLEIPSGDILRGFESMYNLLLKHKSELLSKDGPIEPFSRNSRRLIIRNTRFYGGLGIDAGHPDLLRDDLDRAWHWDNLWNEIQSRPIIEKFIASEMKQIEEGDIPFFTIGLDAVDALGADGTVVESVIPRSGLSLARERIDALSEEGLEKQTWFIRSSLGYVDGYVRKPAKNPDRSAMRSKQPFLAAACDAGDQILSELTRFKDTASLLEVACITGEGENAPSAHIISPAGVELYDGLSGVCLFLAYLGRESGNPAYRQGAEALLRNVQMIMAERLHKWPKMSGFVGLGGLVYLYSHLGTLWARDDLFAEAEVLLQDILPAIPHDDAFDILMGSAGTLLCLLSLCSTEGYEGEALKVAIACGDHLIDRARDSKPVVHGKPARETSVLPDGTQTPTQQDLRQQSDRGQAAAAQTQSDREQASDEQAQTEAQALSGQAPVEPWEGMKVKRGFSHGLTGVALALYELSRATGSVKYLQASLDAIEFERKLLVEGNWTDRHMYQGRPQLSWCHGASGIAIGRLGIYRHFKDSTIRQDIATCLAECRERHWMTSQCLCHGSLGNLEPFVIASRDFPEFGQWSEFIEESARGVIDEIDKTGWLSLLPSQTLGNGLMTGLAGIGYGFLRMHNPEAVPSILSFEAARVFDPVNTPSHSQ